MVVDGEGDALYRVLQVWLEKGGLHMARRRYSICVSVRIFNESENMKYDRE